MATTQVFRHIAIAGRQGHVATFDWQTGSIHAELQLKETCRDITFLQDHTMFAVAQARHIYMYDLNGVELHRLSSHIEPTKLEYLPYHFLLASTSLTGFLKYQDVSTGLVVAQHRSKLGPCNTMCQNPWNAVIHLGHQNGTVTLWTPNSPTPHVRLLAHLGEVTNIAVDGCSSGRYMATSGADGRVKVWDCRNWKGCLRQWTVKTGFSNGGFGAQLDWSQKGMLAVGTSTGIQVFRQPAITTMHTHLATPPLYMTHPIPRSHISSVRFVPHRDLLTAAHSSSIADSGILSHEHVISTLIIPGSGNPHYDTSEGGDPYEGRKGRQEREIRNLLEKLEPSTITIDPDMLGGMMEENKVDETLVYRKQPRLQRLKATGKADETEAIQEEGSDSGRRDEREKKKHKMRGKDRSMKRYLKKKRKNVIDAATVSNICLAILAALTDRIMIGCYTSETGQATARISKGKDSHSQKGQRGRCPGGEKVRSGSIPNLDAYDVYNTIISLFYSIEFVSLIQLSIKDWALVDKLASKRRPSGEFPVQCRPSPAYYIRPLNQHS